MLPHTFLFSDKEIRGETLTRETLQEHKMKTRPIPQLLLGMSLPLMGSMSIQALYNIVDGMFVSRAGEDALTAVSLVFPVQTLMIALATGMGVGVNALLSNNLGHGNYQEAGRTARNGLFLSLLGFLAASVTGVVFAEHFILLQTDAEGVVWQGAVYMRIVCGGSAGLFFSVAFERLLQSAGRMVPSMFVQLLGAVVNIVMDPILIFGFGFFPCMGVAGAAMATVLGQAASLCLGLVLNLTMNGNISLNMSRFRPHAQTLGRICSIGIPSAVVQMMGSALVLALNYLLLMFSSEAVAVYGIYCKLQNFVFMPVYGLGNGMVSIIAYNFGAGNRNRALQTVSTGLIAGAVVTLSGLLAFNMFPDQFLGWFNASGKMEEIGEVALRVLAGGFPFAGYCTIANSVFQALGKGSWGMYLSFVRQIVLALPCACLLGITLGLDAIWWSFLGVEALSAALAAFLLRKLVRRL